MSGEFFPLTHWTWWVSAVLLVVVEVFVPGTFFLWMGLSAGVLGAVVFFVPDLPWEIQLTLFAVFSVTAIFASRKYLQRSKDDRASLSSLSARGKRYTGMIVTVEDAIVNGIGKVRVEDTVWRAQGADVAAGERVRITGIIDTTFQVEKIS